MNDFAKSGETGQEATELNQQSRKVLRNGDFTFTE